MNLATVVSPRFYKNAQQLVQTYRYYYGGKAVVYYFDGPIPTEIGADEYIEVPRSCEHAWDAHLYYFKSYALHNMMHREEPFIYADACHRFIRKPAHLENMLRQHTRFLVEYPKLNNISIGSFTTNLCLRLLDADTLEVRNAPMYWAAIQAWVPTEENKRFANDFLTAMSNAAIAGPSNVKEYPEGRQGCKAHRNDQSVLSVLIHKYRWSQPYTEYCWQMYGDHDTVQTATLNPAIKGRCKLSDPMPPPQITESKQSTIGGVISFCSNDREFLAPCIEHLSPICKDIVVIYADKLFDGTNEDHSYLQTLPSQYPTVKFRSFALDRGLSARSNHNLQRYEGAKHLLDVDYIMFVDVDEIVDDVQFRSWWESGSRPIAPTMRLSAYYYYYSPALQATHIDQAPVLIEQNRWKQLDKKFLVGLPSERDSLLKHFPDYQEWLPDRVNPLVHHYCLVRTKEEMLRKTKSWGHKDDKNWPVLVEQYYGVFGPGSTNAHYTMRCKVCHTRQIRITYGKGSYAILRPHTPIELVLSTEDRLRLRSEGLDVIELGEPLGRDEGIIVKDFWHGYDYRIVDPFIRFEKYISDPTQLKLLLGLDKQTKISYTTP